SSRLTKLPPIDRFKNLRVLEIENKSIRDLAPLSALKRLERLTIDACKADDLSELRGQPFENVRLIGGNISHFDWTTQTAWCQRCTLLVSFEGAEIEGLEIESCKKVDLSSLASVRGLVSLTMVGTGPAVANFDFVSGCRDLKNLTITTPLSKAN